MAGNVVAVTLRGSGFALAPHGDGERNSYMRTERFEFPNAKGEKLAAQLDLPLGEPDRLTLYPHFFDRLVPGWFDKRLRYRRHGTRATDRTLLVCPSPAFIAGLPHGKVPDRQDFYRYTPEERVAAWRQVVDACRVLADELYETLQGDRLAARLTPL